MEMIILPLLLVATLGTNVAGRPVNKNDCQYLGHTYPEHTQVSTGEPCLKCACLEGSLVCYLRVCPEMPSPPPKGCVILHRKRQCCPELMCHGLYYNRDRYSNGVSYRAELQSMQHLKAHKEAVPSGEACIINGTVYRSGSATATSSLCEYCYCIGGKQQCIRPNCLMPLRGCNPIYDSASCCPVRYTCLVDKLPFTTTTVSSLQTHGCFVDGTFYHEGTRVHKRGKKQSHCDNCFCMRGKIRCAPLSCAGPLHGCLPIVRSGECCAASYNCSGDVESRLSALLETDRSFKDAVSSPLIIVKVLYGNDRDNPRLEINRSINSDEVINRTTQSTELAAHHSVKTAEISTPTTEDSSFSSDITNETENATNSGLATTLHTNLDDTTYITTDLSSATTDETTITNSESSTTDMTSTTDAATTTLDAKYNISELEHRLQESDIESTESDSNSTNDAVDITDVTTELNDEMTTNAQGNHTYELEDVTTGQHDLNISETVPPFKTIMPEIETILNSTLKKGQEDDYDYDYDQPTLPPSLPNVRIIKFEAADAVKTKEGATSFSQEISYDLNPTPYPPQIQDKYDTLGLSLHQEYRLNHSPYIVTPLPGLPEIGATANPTFESEDLAASGFSPPAETEGGFVPRIPLQSEGYYDTVLYHTSPLSVSTETSVPVAITNPPKTDIDSCVANGQEWRHGEYVPVSSPGSDSPPEPTDETCVTCLCFYGDLMCSEQPVKCPPLKRGCRRLSATVTITTTTSRQRIISDTNKELATMPECCGTVICDMPEESPTVVLDRIDVTSPQDSVTIAAGIIDTPDPFRDVIRTEPAPDLKSLIGDMAFMSSTVIPSTTDSMSSSFSVPTSASTTSAGVRPILSFIHEFFNLTADANDTTAVENSTTITGSDERQFHTTTKSTSREPATQTTTEVIKNTYSDLPHEAELVKDTEPDILTAANLNDDFPETTTEEDSLDYEGESAFESVFNLFFPGNKETSTAKTFPSTTEASSTKMATLTTTTVPDVRASLASTTLGIPAMTSTESSIRRSQNNITTLGKHKEMYVNKYKTAISASFMENINQTPNIQFIVERPILNFPHLETVTTETPDYSNIFLTTKAPFVPFKKQTVVRSKPNAVGLLKLAGCNIYGRMYRVDKIIIELSGPCLECRCTEIGVQCTPLKC